MFNIYIYWYTLHLSMPSQLTADCICELRAYSMIIMRSYFCIQYFEFIFDVRRPCTHTHMRAHGDFLARNYTKIWFSTKGFTQCIREIHVLTYGSEIFWSVFKPTPLDNPMQQNNCVNISDWKSTASHWNVHIIVRNYHPIVQPDVWKTCQQRVCYSILFIIILLTLSEQNHISRT